MSQIEQIKAEIERRSNEFDDMAEVGEGRYYQGLADGLEMAKQLIDSLQDEPAPNIDLIKKTWYIEGYTDAENKMEPMWKVEHFNFIENPEYGKPLPKENTSADLAEEINTIHARYPEISFAKLSRVCVRIAKWQRAQIEKEWLEDRDGCFRDGVQEGKKAMEEQMLKDAIELPIKIDAGGYPYIQITGIEFFDYDKDEPTAKEGDIVKVLIIREDENEN